ncbi:MAG: DUF4125 family protein [Coprococcus sp.]
MSKDTLISEIIRMEWEAFDKTKNEGGRADCQDDWDTFNIMRKSQYMAWNEEMLESWHSDLVAAVESGENLITYKYGYMMESTAPERFAEIKNDMPTISDEKRKLIDQIVAIQVGWMEEFAEKYPKLAGNARSIHTSEDNMYNTSSETYLRGELMTYSDNTLILYGRFVAGLAREGRNLNRMTMENTIKLYGYKTLEDAERAM